MLPRFTRTGLLPAGLLLLITGWAESVVNGCSYEQVLQPGERYFVYSPNYPNAYSGENYCRWRATASRPFRLTCNVMQLPYSPNCNADRLVVRTRTTARAFCNDVTFTIDAYDEMQIFFNSSGNSPGGRFLCFLQTIDTAAEANCQCGWKNPTRIVGGIETGVNEFPMMAGVVDLTAGDLACGGTIISNTCVLTAAHCVYNRQPNAFGVLVGDHNISSSTDTAATRLFPVEDIIVHPEYDGRSPYNDIAVMRIRGTMEFGMAVGPACLPFRHNCDSFIGSYVSLLGWGTQEFAGPRSDTLQKVQVNVIPTQECQYLEPNYALTSSQMCTYGYRKDSCQFDSGGPVLWQDPATRTLTLVSVIASGGVCGQSPGVNTRVGDYVDWIQSVTPYDVYCRVE